MVFGRNIDGGPRLAVAQPAVLHQRQPLPFRVLETEHGATVVFDDGAVRYAQLGKAIRPPCQAGSPLTRNPGA